MVGECVRILFTSCEQNRKRTSAERSERVSLRFFTKSEYYGTSEPTMKLFVYFISTEISFKQ